MAPRGDAADELRRTATAAREAFHRLRAGLESGVVQGRAGVELAGAEAERLLAQLAAEIAAELARDQLREHAERCAEAESQFEAGAATLASEREAWLQERAEWEQVREQVEAELAAIEGRLVAEAKALREARSEAAGGVELLAELEAAHAALSLAEADRDTLQGKFDMALADAQSHRQRVAELEAELASAPGQGAVDGVASQLAQLVEERDELLRRITELEQAGRVVEGDEAAGWRTKFELAVEDLREHKVENQRLRDQLASAPRPACDPEEGGWEAQKRRLLEALESEGSSEDPVREEERATVAGAVQITDAVVAAKDAEIERLRAALEGYALEAAGIEADGVLDADELIRGERERLARLEAEWQEKVRQAELELSVERAKIARAQSEIADQQLELETLRAAAKGGVPSGEARRNWLNKLGLGGETAG